MGSHYILLCETFNHIIIVPRRRALTLRSIALGGDMEAIWRRYGGNTSLPYNTIKEEALHAHIYMFT